MREMKSQIQSQPPQLHSLRRPGDTGLCVRGIYSVSPGPLTVDVGEQQAFQRCCQRRARVITLLDCLAHFP